MVPISNSLSVGEGYTTFTNVSVIETLETWEDELKFSDLYSGCRLKLTVEYLAKQHEAMDWDVFYKETYYE